MKHKASLLFLLGVAVGGAGTTQALERLTLSYAPGEIILVDPSGRRAGWEEPGGPFLREIPRSEGVSRNIHTPSPQHDITVQNPPPGLYKIILNHPPTNFLSRTGVDYHGEVSFDSKDFNETRLYFDGSMETSATHVYQFTLPDVPTPAGKPIELLLDAAAMAQGRGIMALTVQKHGNDGDLLVLTPRKQGVGRGYKPLDSFRSMAEVAGSSWHHTQTSCRSYGKSFSCAQSTWIFLPSPEPGAYTVVLTPTPPLLGNISLQVARWGGAQPTVATETRPFRLKAEKPTEYSFTFDPRSSFGPHLNVQP